MKRRLHIDSSFTVIARVSIIRMLVRAETCVNCLQSDRNGAWRLLGMIRGIIVSLGLAALREKKGSYNKASPHCHSYFYSYSHYYSHSSPTPTPSHIPTITPVLLLSLVSKSFSYPRSAPTLLLISLLSDSYSYSDYCIYFQSYCIATSHRLDSFSIVSKEEQALNHRNQKI